MSKTKHTCGPWKIRRHQITGSPVTITRKKKVICEFFAEFNSKTEFNAQLIVVAPELADMVETLKNILLEVKRASSARQSYEITEYLVSRVRAAEKLLAKARGEK